jgi:hypothetical protein
MVMILNVYQSLKAGKALTIIFLPEEGVEKQQDQTLSEALMTTILIVLQIRKTGMHSCLPLALKLPFS